MSVRIEDDLAASDRRLMITAVQVPAADRRTQAGNGLAELEWFRDVIISPRVEGEHFVVFAVHHGQHENRQIGSGSPDTAARLHATHARHVNVQENSVKARHAN
jgi:hypothetical protein